MRLCVAARARAGVRGIFSSEACIFFDVILTQRTRPCAIDAHFIFIMCVSPRAEARQMSAHDYDCVCAGVRV